MTTGEADGGQPADDVLAGASPAVPPRPARRRSRRPGKHVTERFGILRRIRSAFALIVLTVVTGAALAALLVAVVALIVIALRHAGG